MRLIFMGTPLFSLPVLKKLYEQGHDIVAVYTQPPRPKNRGYHVQKSPIHEYAESLNIPVFTPKTFKDPQAKDIFQNHKADVAVVVAYGLILPKDILEAPTYGCLNIHGSLLPRWRGAAPIHRAMLAGDPVTGITTMQMDEGLDTGDMLLKEEYPLSMNDTFQKVHDDLSEIGANLMIQTLNDLEKGCLAPEKQKNDGVTYAKKLEKEESAINFKTMTAEQVLRHIKTLNPWPGSFVMIQGEKIKIHDAIFITSVSSSSEKPGTYWGQGYIACSTGVIQLTKLQRPGGRVLDFHDFIRGFPITTLDEDHPISSN